MKKNLWIIGLLGLFMVLTGCKGKKSDIEQIIQNISASESALTGYTEQDTIQDGDWLVYSKNISFWLDRTEGVKTKFTQTEQIFSSDSDSPSTEMKTEETSYVTIDDKKYETINGTEQESAYTVPKYFLTFRLEEDYLEDAYTVNKENNIWRLTASVKEESIGGFFLNKNVSGITGLSVVLEFTGERLTVFEAKYTSYSGLPVLMKIVYSYESVEITR